MCTFFKWFSKRLNLFLRWTTSLVLFALSFYLTWVLYAVVYYVICLLHGDFDPASYAEDEDGNVNFTPCILEVDGFAAAFLFSLETQHTIG